jgi:hypothetical protein
MKIVRSSPVVSLDATKILTEAIPTITNKPIREKLSLEDQNTAAARSAAVARTKAIATYAKDIRFKSWDDLAVRYNVQVPLSCKSTPCTYLNVLKFCNQFVETAVAESRKPAEAPAPINEDIKSSVVYTPDGPVKIPTSEELGTVKIGARTLKPRQKKCLYKIRHALFVQRKSASVLLPLGTGTGKTIIAAAVIDDLLKNDYYGFGNGKNMPLWNVICIVPKATKIKFTRELIRCGLGSHLENDIIVRTYSELRSSSMSGLFTRYEKINPYNGEAEEAFKFKLGKPALIIFDESHKLKRKNSAAYKRALGFVGPNTRFLFMSATPAIIGEDLKLFGLSSQLSWGGSIVDEISWSNFGRQVGEGSMTALRRGEHVVANIFSYYDRVASAIVNPPADPRKHKSYNGVKFINFKSEESRARYERAQEKWLELCRKNGKEPDDWAARLTAFGNFRQAAEREGAESVVELSMIEHDKGRAPVIMCSYKETIKMCLMEFAKRGIDRSRISVIYGGEPNITAENCLSVYDWMRMHHKVSTDENFVWTDKKARAKYNRSTKYWNTAMKTERSAEEQADMDKWLKTMKLYAQTDEGLQDEIDNFQEGRTEFCIGTMAKAGTGLDLDQQIETARPRTMLAFGTYYAEEFVQAFGRIYREYTLSDAYQWMIMFEGTIITEHVVPILMKKLTSLTSSTGADLDLESKIAEAAANNKLRPLDYKLKEPVAVEITETLVEYEDDEEDE